MKRQTKIHSESVATTVKTQPFLGEESFVLMDTSYRLEPRLLLDGAAAGQIGEIDDYRPQDETHEQTRQATENQPLAGILESIRSNQQENTAKHLIIVAGDIDKDHTLKQGLMEHATIVYLDPDQSSLRQILTVLQDMGEVDGLHLVSHGAQGVLDFGSEQLVFQSLSIEQERSLGVIGSFLSAEGDLYVYGCDFGAGPLGEQAVERLAEITGADVAASDDITGVSGDWKLEVNMGDVAETEVFSQSSLESFDEDLQSADFSGGQDLNENDIKNYFDGAEAGNSGKLHPGTNFGYADTGQTPRQDDNFLPMYRNRNVHIDPNGNAFVLLSKNAFDLDRQKVTIRVRFTQGVGRRASAVVGLVREGAEIDSIHFGGAGEKEIGMIGNYIDQRSSGSGDGIRNAHIASFATYLAESWDRGGSAPRTKYYSALRPVTPSSGGTSVVLGKGASGTQNTIDDIGDTNPGSDLPEAYYKNGHWFGSEVEITLFKEDGKYYMRINNINRNEEINREKFYESRDGANASPDRDIYKSETGTSLPGIELETDANGELKFKIYIAMGSSISTQQQDVGISYLTIVESAANEAPTINSTANFPVPSVVGGSDPTDRNAGTSVRDLIASRVNDIDGSNDKIGIVLTDFSSGFDHSRHKVFIGRLRNGVFTWTQITPSMLQGNNDYILIPEDRLHIVATDPALSGSAAAPDVLNFRAWDGFSYQEGPISNADYSAENSPFSATEGTIKTTYRASGDPAELQRVQYVALFDEGDPTDDVILADTTFGLGDLQEPNYAGNEYKFYYVMVFDQAVKINAASSASFTLDQSNVSASLVSKLADYTSSTWTLEVTAQRGFEGAVEISLTDSDLFLTKGGKNLLNNSLLDNAFYIDLKSPIVNLQTNNLSVNENDNFADITITTDGDALDTTHVVHTISDVSGLNLDRPSAFDLFEIVNNRIRVRNTIDFEALFPTHNQDEGALTLTITTMDRGGNTALSKLTVTVVDENENTAPTQTATHTYILNEDTSQTLSFDDLGLEDSNERGVLSTDESAFADSDFIRISGLPTSGDILVDNGQGSLRTLGLNDTIARSDIVNNRVIYRAHPNKFTSLGSADVLQFRAKDSEGLRQTADSTISFRITPVNDLPTMTGVLSLSILKNNNYNFSASDFLTLFSDPEDDLTLPANNGGVAGNAAPTRIYVKEVISSHADSGRLEFNGSPVVYDSGISNFSNLIYTSTGASQGTFTIIVYGEDSDGLVNAHSTASIVIALTDDPNPPVVADTTLMGTEDQQFTRFPDQGNEYQYVDNEGEAFDGLIIASLPRKASDGTSAGTLQLNGQAVLAGTRISKSDIQNLTFIPELNFVGTAQFSFQAYNVTGAASDEKIISIILQSADDPIVSSDNTISIDEDVATAFKIDDFPYSDPDDPSKAHFSLTVKSIPDPALGTLMYRAQNGNPVAVTLNQQISGEDIRNGRFFVQPAKDNVQRFQFNFTLTNQGALDSGLRTLNIEIIGADDAPTSQNKVITYQEDFDGPGSSRHVFRYDAANPEDARTNDFIYRDPEGDSFELLVITNVRSNSLGTLMFGGTAYVLGNRIDADQIDTLSFVFDAHIHGDAELEFKVINDKSSQSEEYTLTFQVESVEDPPEITNIPTISVQENQTVTYSSADFPSLVYLDPDVEDELVGIMLSETSIAGVGAFYIGSGTTMAGTVVSRQDLNRLEFRAIGATTTSPRNPSVEVKLITGHEDATGQTVTQMSDPVTMSIVVENLQDRPTSRNQEVTVSEDRTYDFLESDFFHQDADGDPFGGIQLESGLPDPNTVGELRLNGVSVTVGQAIEKDQIPNLSFVPAANRNGEFSFHFKVFSAIGTNREFSAIAYSMKVNILAVDDAPESGDVSVTIGEDRTLEYGNSGFIFPFSDTDGEDLVEIRFASDLGNETRGSFSVSGQNITGNNFLKSQLDDILFTPKENFTGTIILPFRVVSMNADGDPIESMTLYELSIEVTAEEDKPLTRDKTVSIQEDQLYSFRVNLQNPEDTTDNNDFYFSDAEGGQFGSIRITSLPSGLLGTLKLNNVAVMQNQEIDVNEIQNLVFEPVANVSGTTTFTFQVINRGRATTNDESEISEITIIIDPVDDEPRLGAGTQTQVVVNVQEGMTATYTENDFEFPYYDPDPGAELRAVVFSNAIPSTVGTFIYNGRAISGNSIDASMLDERLEFVPHSTFAGDRTFRFYLEDKDTERSQNYSFIISVGDIDQKPTSENRQFSINEDSTYTFKANLNASEDTSANNSFPFIQVGNDAELFGGVRISTLPSGGSGSLLLNGGTITLGQEISRSDINSLSFVPHEHYSGEVTFQFNVYDDGDAINKYSDNFTFSIGINEVDDLPTVENADELRLALMEGETISYGTDPFIIQYRDVEGDIFAGIHLPSVSDSAGRFYLNDQILTRNDVSFSDLDGLSFVAAQGAHTNVIFKFQVFNANGRSQEYDIVVNVGAVDDPPTAGDINIQATESLADAQSILIGVQILSELGANGAAAYSDPENQGLGGIIIQEGYDPQLFGQLMLGDQVVTSGTTISTGDLQNLRVDLHPDYEPGTRGDRSQTHTAKFRVYNEVPNRVDSNGAALDDIQTSVGTYQLRLTIVPTDDPPQGKDITATVQEDRILRYNTNGFVFEVVDPDTAPDETTVTLSVVPPLSTGTLYLNDASGSHTLLQDGSTVLYTDYTRLRFKGAENYFGEYTFSFEISNTSTNNTGSYTGIIDIQPEADNPESQGHTILVNEGDTYTFKYADTGRNAANPFQRTDFIFNDPDTGDFTGVRIYNYNAITSFGTILIDDQTYTQGDLIMRDDLTGGMVSLVTDPHNEMDFTLSFVVVADRMSNHQSREYDLVFDVYPLSNSATVVDSEVTIDEDQTLNLPVSSLNIIEPDPSDTLTVVVFEQVPPSSEGALLYGTVTIVGSNETITISDQGNFDEPLSFVPAGNFNTDGGDPLQIVYHVRTGSDVSLLERSDPGTISITINPIDDPISGRNLDVTIREGETRAFTRDEFRPNGGANDDPNDPDEGEHLESVVFRRVPSDRFGSFVLEVPPAAGGAAGATADNITVTNGATIEVANLDNLRFIADQDYDQPVTATFALINNNQAESPEYGLTINIEAQQDNPEVVGDAPSIEVEAGLVTEIEAEMFTNLFRDADSGDSMLGIILHTLPPSNIGHLALNGVGITGASVTVLVEDLPGLSFVPIGTDPDEMQVSGDGSFKFSLLDQDSNQSISTEFTVTVVVDPNPPQTSGRNIYVPSDATRTFSEHEFPYLDADDDEFIGVHFLNRPDRGVFYLEAADGTTTTISAGSRVAMNDLGLLQYKVEDGSGDFSVGTEEIIFRVYNSRNAESSEATITIHITDSVNLGPTPIHPPDQSLPGHAYVQVDRGFVFRLVDALPEIFKDPEGDDLTVVSVDGLAGSGLVYNARTGVISGQPTLSNSGRYQVTVDVRDHFGGEARQTFDLIVANLLAQLAGGNENSIEPTLEYIYNLDHDDALPKNFAMQLYMSEIEDVDSAHFLSSFDDVTQGVLANLLNSVDQQITQLRIKIAPGGDFALLYLYLANDDVDRKSPPFSLAIKLATPSFDGAGPGLTAPGAHYGGGLFRAVEAQGEQATISPYSQQRPTDANILESSQEKYDNTAAYRPGVQASETGKGRSLQEIGEIGRVSPPTYPNIRTPRPSEPARDVLNTFNRIDAIGIIGKAAVEQQDTLKTSFSSAAEDNVVLNPGGRTRDELFSRTENAFFSKRPVDRVITAALNRQAGDVYSIPLPDPDQSASSLWSILRSGGLPVSRAVLSLFPTFGERTPLPTPPTSSAPSTLTPLVEEDEERLRAALPSRPEQENLQEIPEVTTPDTATIDETNDQREEFLTRLLSILGQQQPQGAQESTQGGVQEENQEEPEEDSDRVRDLELLNRLIRGR